MTKNPVSIASFTTIKDTTEIFIEKGFHALPVVDNGNLVGIVSTTDVLEYLLEIVSFPIFWTIQKLNVLQI